MDSNNMQLMRERFRALRQRRNLAASPRMAELQNMHDMLLRRPPPPTANHEGGGMSLRNRNLQPTNLSEEHGGGARESGRPENVSRRTEHESGAHLRNDQNSTTRMNASDNSINDTNNVSV